MWTGRRGRLRRKLLAIIGSVCQRENLQYIPEDETLEVVSEPHAKDNVVEATLQLGSLPRRGIGGG